MDEREVLREAARLVRQGWSQGAFARDWKGHTVLVRSFRATNFCAVGAIRYWCGETNHDLALRAEQKLLEVLRRRDSALTVVKFNDAPGRTADEVAAALEEAAAQ